MTDSSVATTSAALASSPSTTGSFWRLSTVSAWLTMVWIWAIWACLEYWEANPNYSYGWVVPVLALGFAVRRFFVIDKSLDSDSRAHFRFPAAATWAIAIAVAILALALEYCREQVLHPIITVWVIALFAVTSTLAIFWLVRGRRFARWECFPILFFLTAVPWPPRIEQPLTGALMRWVALTTAEVLHWIGIEAQVAGGAIALQTGLVGITEACSGIRSLQAGVMFGLAIGEWFLLSAARRVFLLGLAIVFAIGTNLGRTLILTVQANNHGIEAVDRLHDTVGTIMVTILIAAIWVAGRLLRPRRPAVPVRENAAALPGPDLSALQHQRSICVGASLGLIAGLLGAHVAVARMEASDATQSAPYFAVRDPGSDQNHLDPIPKTVWTELHPTSGEYIHRDPAEPSTRGADCFHFFWKPSPWNRFALVHRPDICMPGVGWQLDGPAQTQNVDIDGHSLQFYVFRFHRGSTRALELWGAWRNGELVPIDYRPDQVLGPSAAPGSLHLEGKRRSATEIVSCNMFSLGNELSADSAAEVLSSVFRYQAR